MQTFRERQFQEEEKNLNRLSELSKCLGSFTEKHDENIHSIMEIVSKILNADSCILFEKQGSYVSIKAGCCIPVTLGNTWDFQGSICEHVFNIRKETPVFVIDTASMNKQLRDPVLSGTQPFFKCFLSCVINPNGFLKGCLCLFYKRKRLFLPEDMELFYLLSRIITIEMENKEAQIEKNKLIKCLQYTHRLKMLTSFTKTMACEFNNILTSIIGYADFILSCKRYRTDLSLIKPAKNIRDSGLRAAMRITQLLTLSMEDDEDDTVKMKLDINKEILKFKDILVREMSKNVNITFELMEPMEPIQLNRVLFQEIFFNLITNAKNAMVNAGAGTITISTGVEVFNKKPHQQATDIKLRRYVRMSVSDTGCGIKPEMIKYIYNPFFTTGDVKKSLGLGLFIVQNIVKEHFGFIKVESEWGRGTKFSIYFPVCSQPMVF